VSEDAAGPDQQLAEQFEAHRAHLLGVAYRVLGAGGEAQDAVQEAWLRLQRTGSAGVDNLGGWLTTVVARISLNLLRSRGNRRTTPLEDAAPAGRGDPHAVDPQDEAVQADAVGVAMLVVLDTLTPAERVAFVLHDMFAVPFDELAAIVDTSPANARQLASRARRRVQGATPDGAADELRRREIVEAFLAASRHGDFARLLAVLDPEVALRADEHAVRLGAAGVVVGAREVAEAYTSRARGVRPALVNGVLTFVSAPAGVVRAVFDLAIVGGLVRSVEVITDPAVIADLAPEILEED